MRRLALIICIAIWGSCSQKSTQLLANAESSSSTANKKYTAAAESAMKTIQSFSKGSRQPNLPNLLSESALMDKETNAIYWQGGGALTISNSLTKPYLTQKGVVHVKATILTIVLWLWVWGHVSRYLISRYFSGDAVVQGGRTLLFSLPFISTTASSGDDTTKMIINPILNRIASFLTPIVQFVLLLLHSLLYLRLPEYSTKVITTTIILYLLEAYNCSTRRYLSNGMNAPSEVESYLEKIRTVEPMVTWKVRCFHYEKRELWKSWKGLIESYWMMKKKNQEGVEIGGSGMSKNLSSSLATSSEAFAESPPFWMARKVVTHQAVSTYKFGR